MCEQCTFSQMKSDASMVTERVVGDTDIKYDQIVDVHCLDNHIRSRAASIMLFGIAVALILYLYYARFYATPQSIMLLVFYKTHLFMNPQLPLHTA